MYRSLRALPRLPHPHPTLAAPLLLRSTAIAKPTHTLIRALVTLPPTRVIIAPISIQHGQISKRWASSKSSDKKSEQNLTDQQKAALANQTHARDGVTQGAGAELRGVASDLASMISGRSGKGNEDEKPDQATLMAGAREVSSHSHSGSVKDDFMSITRGIITTVPQPIMVFGLAGTLPYLGTALGTIFLSREAARASQGLNTITGMDVQGALSALHHLESIQITYGALIISFLGALHWGMEFSKYGGRQGYPRLILGTIPLVLAWPTTFLSHGAALVAQWGAFTGTWFLDQNASTRGWTPAWYATYRFYLSIIVGLSIIATFAGTGYYGAGAGATVQSKDTRYLHTTERVGPYKRMLRIEEAKHPKGHEVITGVYHGETSGDVETDDTGEDGDAYMRIRNIKKEEEQAEEEAEEEKKKKEEETKKNEEFQDKRDEKQQEKAPGDMKKDAPNRTGANQKADNKGKEGSDADTKSGGDEGETGNKDEKKKGKA